MVMTRCQVIETRDGRPASPTAEFEFDGEFGNSRHPKPKKDHPGRNSKGTIRSTGSLDYA